MKKFSQLISQSPNQYGLQYKPIKPLNTNKTLLQNIQNSYLSPSPSQIQNPQTVQIYLKSSPTKSLKLNLPKRTPIPHLKSTIQDQLHIPLHHQLLYLNGKQISMFAAVVLNDKEIIHINDRKQIVGVNQSVSVGVKVFAPKETGVDGKVYAFDLTGGHTIQALKTLLLTHIDFHTLTQTYDLNFLHSGTILNPLQTLTQNLITKHTQLTCLLSEYPLETKFHNQTQSQSQPQPQQSLNYKRIETNSPTKIKKPTYEPNQQQPSYVGLKFNKPRITSNKFMVGKPKNPIYNKIFKPNHDPNDQFIYNGHSLQNESQASQQSSGFKKKKPYPDNYDTDDSSLIKKIVVRKSREQIEKIAQNCLIKEDIKEKSSQKKSIVSSSSEEEDNTQNYIPIRQQKQYRPCPLIPQRKMAPSQKIKINMELQKLFGGGGITSPQHQNRPILFETNQNEENTQGELPIETNRSRVVVKNSSLRNSIGSKDSILRIVKDRKLNNRYGEENAEEMD